VHTRLIALVLIGVCLPLATGCQKPAEPIPIAEFKKDYDRPLPPGEFALRKITDPAMYPDFGAAWYRAKGIGLREAVQRSIDYMGKPSSQTCFPVGPITHERTLASLHRFLEVLDDARSPDALNQAVREQFDVYMSVGCDDSGTVLFTGYYSPIFDGSKVQTDEFRFPLYRLPPDFQKDDAGDPVGGPWYTREEIESQGVLDGHELVWLRDPFEAYVITVQGSGFIRLPDGSLYEIGYAGHNDHEYVAIGQLLVADGKIDRNRLSLDAMIRYFREHPEDLPLYVNQNKRYIMFHEATGGPYGCLGQPVTPYHAVATDKDIFPRAALSFVDTYVPQGPQNDPRRFRSFVLDQDRGAAIRAPGRCDIYMGVGEAAGRIAGFTYSEGRLYYLFVKDGLLPAEKVEPEPVVRGAGEDEAADPTFGRLR